MTTQVSTPNPIDRLMVLRAQVQATHASDFAAAVLAARVFVLVLLPVDVLTAGLDDFPDAVELRGGIATSSCGWMATFLLLL